MVMRRHSCVIERTKREKWVLEQKDNMKDEVKDLQGGDI